MKKQRQSKKTTTLVDKGSTETLTDKSVEQTTVRKELKENVRELEEWFKEAESVLREPLKFNQMWTRTAIDAKMKEIQVGEFTNS